MRSHKNEQGQQGLIYRNSCKIEVCHKNHNFRPKSAKSVLWPLQTQWVCRSQIFKGFCVCDPFWQQWNLFPSSPAKSDIKGGLAAKNWLICGIMAFGSFYGPLFFKAQRYSSEQQILCCFSFKLLFLLAK